MSLGWELVVGYAIGILSVLLTIVLLVLNYRVIRDIRIRQEVIEHFEQELVTTRPLYSTLYSTHEEIMDLAIEFMNEASQVYALGTINSLQHTEIRYGEREADFKKRLLSLDSRTRLYVATTTDYILSGRLYCRILDFNPIDSSDEAIFEILANVNYFLRLMQSQAVTTQGLQLQLYHNAGIAGERGDFHFRCSDRKVVIRVGGPANEFVNSAIVITDTRVIDRFQGYYQSLVSGNPTKSIGADNLLRLQQLLVAKDLTSVRTYLSDL